jgi:N-acetylneuraminic acid mutarotase
MIIWGGENTGNTGCIYDLSSDSWASISSIIAPNSIRNDAVWTGNKMILWGGLDGNNNYAPTNAGFIYDPITNTWNNLTSSGEINARSLFTSVWTGTQMIIWGGFDGSSTINTGGVYTP